MNGPQSHDTGRDHANVRHPRHEGGEPVARRDPTAPRSVGEQAHHDLEQGLEDTDRRGGDDYQRRTQNDNHANRNAQAPGGTKRNRR
jgi:hypothetical protein